MYLTQSIVSALKRLKKYLQIENLVLGDHAHSTEEVCMYDIRDSDATEIYHCYLFKSDHLFGFCVY